MLLPVLAGCSVIADKAGSREVVVVFVDNATPADAARVRADCTDFPNITVSPEATNKTAANRRYPLRYDVTRAGELDINALAVCLSKDTSVRTFLTSGGGAN